MPVKSLNSSVLRWPSHEEVVAAVKQWVREEARRRPELLELGYFGSYARGDWAVGSDLDLVAIVDDRVTDDFIKRLVDAIFHVKYRLLITPHLKEEIDYVVKKLERVRDQVRFDTFRHMVACKILREGAFLFGSEALFSKVKAMLFQYEVIQKLNTLEQLAKGFRRNSEEYLLREAPENVKQETLYLFYPTEESEEFE